MMLALLAVVLIQAAVSAEVSASAAARPPVRDAEAEAFVRELLLQRPDGDRQFKCRLRMVHEGGRRSSVLVTFTGISGEESWQDIYETTGEKVNEQLIVLHRGLESNQYIYRQESADQSGPAAPRVLECGQANLPFAGSDFWLSDLGLEFLHWPQQRLVRDAKITMRKSRPCKVVESTNPNPGGGGYSRVESWIDSEFGGLIYAKAYDAKGSLLKVFELSRFKKVQGTYQVSEMEIRNEKTDSRTRLEFLFDE